MISLNNVSKKFDNLQILKNFNISFEDNKITCIFGPSGVGKTTIANIAAKIIPFEEGSVTGTENAAYSYVFQEPRLMPWYSIYENIDFVLKDVYENNERKKIVNNFIDMVDLTEFKDLKPNELSGGMAQRVSLARAFAYPSNILIMDEPFKGLDEKLKQEMICLFQRLWKENKRTVLFITHDVDEAASLSHSIYILKNRPAEIVQLIDKNLYSDLDDIKKILLSC